MAGPSSQKMIILSSSGISIAIGSVIALAVMVLGVANAHATTYVYTGNSFTSATLPYTTSDKVTGNITLSVPLNAGMPETDETANVTAFSFTDGVQTITNLTVGVSLYSADFQTNLMGGISSWDIQINLGNNEILTQAAEDLGYINFSYSGEGSNSGNPGSWNVASAVPEASTWAMTLLGFAGIGFMFCRRKSKPALIAA
jgi:hypothetical protein